MWQEEPTPAVADSTVPAATGEDEPYKRSAEIPCPDRHRFHCGR
jgi:hypothetical protein